MDLYIISYSNGFDAPEYIAHYIDYSEALDRLECFQAASDFPDEYTLFTIDIMQQIKQEYI